MLTASALRSVTDDCDPVTRVATLVAAGWPDKAIRAQLRARRWQRVGHAIVRHNGPLSRDDHLRVALINQGPRAVATAFTAAELFGLTGWERDEIHVLVPRGARVAQLPGVRIHYVGRWSAAPRHAVRPLHLLAPALVVAAASFAEARPACGILAAAVQQRLLRASDLHTALAAAPRTRHRATLAAAVGDIAQGAHALSELDFVKLCRRHRLPPPRQQAIRLDSAGNRRFLDAEWYRYDGRRVVAEVDGAIHRTVTQWVADLLRQNELLIGDDIVLRYPSIVVRTDEVYVATQLRRVLLGG